MTCLLDDYNSKLGIYQKPLQLAWLKFFMCLLTRCTSYVEMSVLFTISLNGYFLNERRTFYFAYTRYKLSLRCADTKKISHSVSCLFTLLF